jgi:hypothetical protein
VPNGDVPFRPYLVDRGEVTQPFTIARCQPLLAQRGEKAVPFFPRPLEVTRFDGHGDGLYGGKLSEGRPSRPAEAHNSKTCFAQRPPGERLGSAPSRDENRPLPSTNSLVYLCARRECYRGKVSNIEVFSGGSAKQVYST